MKLGKHLAQDSNNDAAARSVPRPTQNEEPDIQKTALAIAEAGLDKKAINVEIIDVRGKVDYTDFIIVMSGRSDRQVNALAKGIEDTLKVEHGVRCFGVEGLPEGHWVLMDFGDVIVHIFHEDTRGYYDIESLWIDAARIEVDQPPEYEQG